MLKPEITYDEYELLTQRISKNPYKCKTWWPTIEEIKERIEPNLEKNFEFLIWIMETANDPITEAEKECKSYIRKLLYKINIVDDGGE